MPRSTASEPTLTTQQARDLQRVVKGELEQRRATLIAERDAAVREAGRTVRLDNEGLLQDCAAVAAELQVLVEEVRAAHRRLQEATRQYEAGGYYVRTYPYASDTAAPTVKNPALEAQVEDAENAVRDAYNERLSAQGRQRWDAQKAAVFASLPVTEATKLLRELLAPQGASK